MTTTAKQTAHDEIKNAASSLAWALISLAKAESAPNSKKDEEHATSLQAALLASVISGELPHVERIEVLWLLRSIASGLEAKGAYEDLRKLLVADMDRLSAAIEAGNGDVPESGALDFLAARRPGRRPRPVRCQSGARFAPGGRAACRACCHRFHCTPHVCH